MHATWASLYHETSSLSNHVQTMASWVLMCCASLYRTGDARVYILELAWRRLARKTNVSSIYVGGFFVFCIDACASLYHTRNSLCDMFRLAGRLPAKKRTYCAGLCGSRNNRDRFLCRFALAMQTHISVICQRLVGLSRYLIIQTS